MALSDIFPCLMHQNSVKILCGMLRAYFPLSDIAHLCWAGYLECRRSLLVIDRADAYFNTREASNSCDLCHMVLAIIRRRSSLPFAHVAPRVLNESSSSRSRPIVRLYIFLIRYCCNVSLFSLFVIVDVFRRISHTPLKLFVNNCQ